MKSTTLINLQTSKEKSVSLKHAYLVVGLAGIVSLLLILSGYSNGRRLNELTSPLFTAIREARLEAEAVQHETTELITLQAGVGTPNIWLYLDHSLWYLQNLLSQNEVKRNNTTIDLKMEALQENLQRIKLVFRAYAEGLKPDGIRNAVSDYKALFDRFYLVLDEAELEIQGMIRQEREIYRTSHLLLALFCMAMTFAVGLTIRRYERHRSASCESVNRANLELENRVLERTRALTEKNKELSTEIEERRIAEEMLLDNRNMLQGVIDGINDALILVDGDMNIRMVNRQASESVITCCPDAAVGQVCYRAAGKSEVCDGCQVREAMTKGKILFYERQSESDRGRLERVTAYPILGNDGLGGHAIVRITDITEEKRFEQQLIKNEKMASLGVLVSSIAHEINNPNNFVSFNIPILKEYVDEIMQIADRHAESRPEFELFNMSYHEFRKDIMKLMDNIEHGSGRISSFVSNLKEFSQGNGERQKMWIDLSSVSEKVLSICRSQIKKRVKNFSVEIPTDQPKIYADGYSLEQVLLNLIVNAAQASDKPDSVVSLSASTGAGWQDHTIIKVSDNGCGMDEETVKHIFDPFFTTKSTSEGTGLGLYVSYNLVRTMGGRLEVQSKAGKGTTFTVNLPNKDRRGKQRPIEKSKKEEESAKIYHFYRHQESRERLVSGIP